MKLNFFAKVLALGALLVAAAPMAKADNITGTIQIPGTYHYTGSGSTLAVTFAPSSPLTLSGISSQASGPLTFTTSYMGGAMKIGTATSGTISPLTTMFRLTNGNVAGVSWQITFQPSSFVVQNGAIIFTGNLNLRKAGSAEGSGLMTVYKFSIPYSGTATGNIDTTASLSPAPEPNSLLLMGTGMLVAAGVVMRKRHVLA